MTEKELERELEHVLVISRNVSLSFLLGLAAQTVGIVWWAATISEQNKQVQKEQIAINQRFERNEQIIRFNEVGIASMNSKLDTVLRLLRNPEERTAR